MTIRGKLVTYLPLSVIRQCCTHKYNYEPLKSYVFALSWENSTEDVIGYGHEKNGAGKLLYISGTQCLVYFSTKHLLQVLACLVSQQRHPLATIERNS